MSEPGWPSSCRRERALGGAALEALHAATRVDQLLLARVERVAVRADLHVDLVLGRARRELVAARAAHVSLDVLRMDVSLHGLHCRAGYRAAQAGAPGHVTVRRLSASARSSTAPVGSTSTVSIEPDRARRALDLDERALAGLERRASARASSVVPSTVTTTSNGAGRGLAAVDDRHDVAGVLGVGAAARGRSPSGRRFGPQVGLAAGRRGRAVRGDALAAARRSSGSARACGTTPARAAPRRASCRRSGRRRGRCVSQRPKPGAAQRVPARLALAAGLEREAHLQPRRAARRAHARPRTSPARSAGSSAESQASSRARARSAPRRRRPGRASGAEQQRGGYGESAHGGRVNARRPPRELRGAAACGRRDAAQPTSPGTAARRPPRAASAGRPWR